MKSTNLLHLRLQNISDFRDRPKKYKRRVNNFWGHYYQLDEKTIKLSWLCQHTHAYTSAYIHISTSTYAYQCLHAHAYIRISMSTYVYQCLHTYINVYMHISTPKCISKCEHTYIQNSKLMQSEKWLLIISNKKVQM